jgi:hypothetical protein
MDELQRQRKRKDVRCLGYSKLGKTPAEMSSERPMAYRRREVGLDLHRAAARLGISPRHLKAVERGQVPLSWRLAGKMAVEYGVGRTDLIRPGRLRGVSGTGKGGAAAGPAVPHTSRGVEARSLQRAQAVGMPEPECNRALRGETPMHG